MGSRFILSEFALKKFNSQLNGYVTLFYFYQKVSHHLLDLAKLPIGEKFSNAVSAMAEQAIDVQKEVRTRLEKFNARYKAGADKSRREKIFKEGDMMMVYLRK